MFSGSKIAALSILMVLSLHLKDNLAGESRIRYPKKIVVPESVPSVASIASSKTDPNQRQRVLPPVLFLSQHYAGWQDCLLEVATSENINSVDDKSGLIASVSQPWSGMGYVAGWRSCLAECQKLSRKVGDSQLKTICEKSLEPLGIVPDTPTDNSLLLQMIEEGKRFRVNAAGHRENQEEPDSAPM